MMEREETRVRHSGPNLGPEIKPTVEWLVTVILSRNTKEVIHWVLRSKDSEMRWVVVCCVRCTSNWSLTQDMDLLLYKNISIIILQGVLKLKNHHGDDSRRFVSRTNSNLRVRGIPYTQEIQHSSFQSWLHIRVTWETLNRH